MSDFSFTSTAVCDYCGNMLGSSDEECDECEPEDRKQQVFRRLTSEGDSPDTIMVDAVGQHRWHKLEEEVGEDWIAYEWLGPRESVQKMVGSYMWETIQDIPKRQMSIDAPDDVGADS